MITFRKLEERDLADRVEWINTPSIFNSMSFDQAVTVKGTQIWYERIKSVPMRYDFVLEDSDALVAMGGITSYQFETKAAESYTFTNPKLQSRGYGTLMLYLSCLFALSLPNLDSVIAYIRPTNASSLRIHQKVGFEEAQDNLRRLLQVDKDDHLVYVLTASSFRRDSVPQGVPNKLKTSLKP